MATGFDVTEAERIIVCVNGWRWEQGVAEYYDLHHACDGFNVYVRNGSPDLERDFDTYPDAREYADGLAKTLNTEVREY